MVDTIIEILTYILVTSGGMAWIVALFNKKYESKWLNGLVKIGNIIAGNVANAKNIK